MQRRSFLATLGAGVVTGCVGSEPTPTPGAPTEVVTKIITPTPTPSPTASPTPTATPEAPRPEIIAVRLVSEWNDYGDVYANAIDEVTIGDYATIAFRHVTPVHDGTLHVFENVNVRSIREDRRVGLRRFEDEQLTEGDGPQRWEHALSFDTFDWSPGPHRAEVMIRDEITGKVSEPADHEFDVVE